MLQKYIKIISAFLLAFSLVSCRSFTDNRRGEQPQIRIVDLEGNPRPVKNYVPEYNAKVLASQGVAVDEKTGDLAPIKNADKTATALAPAVTPAPAVAAPKIEPLPLAINAAPAITKVEEPKKEEEKSENDIEYDLAADSAAKPSEKVDSSDKAAGGKKFKIVAGQKAIKSKTIPTKTTAVKSGGKALFIQIGSYSSERIAKDILAKNGKISEGEIEAATVNGKKFYRVILGPASGQKQAEDLLKKAASAGHKDAFIIKNK